MDTRIIAKVLRNGGFVEMNDLTPKETETAELAVKLGFLRRPYVYIGKPDKYWITDEGATLA